MKEREEKLEEVAAQEQPAAAFSRTFSADDTPRPSEAVVEEPWRVPAEREGQYTRLEELGRGGQSVVRRARDEFIGREVAYKELLPTPDGIASSAWARFLREARLTAQLDHPGIVAIHELGRRADGTLFCSQKLVRGETLKKRLERCGSLDERLQLLPHLIDACRAVAYAHSRGVVHRDLKPSNIMIGPFGETVVVDWGLAKRKDESEEALGAATAPADQGLSVYGSALGTPAYMSPEQARGALAEIDERSDVFSLGAILYELLTARPPFAGESVTQVIDEVRAGRFPRVLVLCPEAPGELAAVSEHALAHAPADRYASAQALSQELSEFRAGGKVTAYRYGARELLRKFVTGHRALSAAVAAALVVLTASSLAIGWQLHVARVNLAQSLLERARAAEQSADWARAAGYYAASRIEHNSRESRWGYSLARERMPRKLYSRQGEQQSMLDVGFTKGGRGLVLGLQDSFLVARDLTTSDEVWRYRLPAKADYFTVINEKVVAVLGGRLLYLDLGDGSLRATFDRQAGLPCHGPLPPPVLRTITGLVTNGGEGKPLLLDPGGSLKCKVSDDGRQVAFQSQDGVVHLWDLIARKELASSPIPDASTMLFTAHGLAVVGARGLHVFGGGEGRFTVAIPRSGGNGLNSLNGRHETVSPDGHLVAVGRLSANQADLVDLRRRTVVSSFSYSPGVHTFTFSPESDKLIVAGLAHGSGLTAWDLRPLVPKLAAVGTQIMAFQTAQERGRFSVLVDPGYQVWNASGEKVLTVEARERGNDAISADGRWLAISDSTGVGIHEIETGKVVWQFSCLLCSRMRLSRDGGRLVTSNADAVELWDVAQRRSIWRETERRGSGDDALDLSEDGQSVLWTRGTSVYIHSHGQSADGELTLEDAAGDAAFSRDGTRLAVIHSSELQAYALHPLRRLWKVSNASSVDQEVQWSSDDSALIILNDSLGTWLIDSGTGARFASVAVTKPGAYGAQDTVLPDLRHRLSRGDGKWELWDMPPPDDGSPRASLQRVLDEAGLTLSGSELVDAAPRSP